jgi:phenol hydroxylase P3 protein
MTLGLEMIKFMLEQDPDNLPIVQGWIDKWFWRGYRVLTLVAAMMDYMLPKRVMSWKEAWEIYGEQNGGALFKDLARYGIRPAKSWDAGLQGQGSTSVAPVHAGSVPVEFRAPRSTPGFRRMTTCSGCPPSTRPRSTSTTARAGSTSRKWRRPAPPFKNYGLAKIVPVLPVAYGVHRAG